MKETAKLLSSLTNRAIGGIIDKIKLKVISVGIKNQTLYGLDIVKICSGMSDENKIEVIRVGIENKRLYGWEIVEICSGMSEENKLKVIRVGIEKLYEKYIVKICSGMSEENKLTVIQDYIERLNEPNIVEICSGMSDTNRSLVVNLAIDKGFFKEDKEKLVETSKEKEDEIAFILSMCEELTDEPNIKELIEKYKLEEYDFSFSRQMVSKYGSNVPCNGNSILFRNDIIEKIGKQNIDQLCKYFAVSGENIPIEGIIENFEEFEKYLEFRKEIFETSQIAILDYKSAIDEFASKKEVILACLLDKNGYIDKNKLRVALKDKRLKIQTLDELNNFAEKRKEYIDSLIENSPNEALVYMLTGMSSEELYRKKRLYIGTTQIEETLIDFPDSEAKDRLKVIFAIQKYIEVIEKMKPEKKKEALRNLNNDLALEFKGRSNIANMRECFDEIEIVMRKMYGQELSQSLRDATSTLPTAIEDDVDKEVKVVKLHGEDFKLLVHGLNAFGKGEDAWQYRDMGKAYICTSLISDKHIGKANASRYYGFNDVGSNILIFEDTCDLYSKPADGKKNSTHITCHQNHFIPTDRMTENTRRYNELTLWREYLGDNGENQQIMPNYIVCFDTIKKGDREEAKRLKIPIVLIYRLKYLTKGVRKDKKENISLGADRYVVNTTVALSKVCSGMQSVAHTASATYQIEATQTLINEMEKEKVIEAQQEVPSM